MSVALAAECGATLVKSVMTVREDFHQIEWDADLEDDLRHLVRLAVREDLGRQNDWTTVALVAPETQGRAAIVARQSGVAAGLRAAPFLIDETDAKIEWQPRLTDGQKISAGD